MKENISIAEQQKHPTDKTIPFDAFVLPQHNMPEGWKKIYKYRYERVDGAVVKYDDNHFYAKPWSERHRGWMAYNPDWHEGHWRYLGYYRKDSKAYIPRKWGSPEAAMKVLNEEIPIKRVAV